MLNGEFLKRQILKYGLTGEFDPVYRGECDLTGNRYGSTGDTFYLNDTGTLFSNNG